MAKIMVLEDEPHLCRLYAEELAHEGHQVIVVGQGCEALCMLQQIPVDLVIKEPGMKTNKTQLKPPPKQLPFMEDELVETDKPSVGNDKLWPPPGVRVISGAWALIVLLGMLVLLVLYEFLQH